MESFTTKALELQRLAHQLLFFEEDAFSILMIFADKIVRFSPLVIPCILFGIQRALLCRKRIGSLSGSINGV